MRIFTLELKRLAKTRMIWISIVVAVLLSVIIAISAISSEEYDYAGKNNSMQQINGIAAIVANKKQTKPFEGKLTVGQLQSDLRVFHSLTKKYGSDMPYDLYCKELLPRMNRLNLIANIYYGDANIFSGLSHVYPSDITYFYAQRDAVLKNELKRKYPNNSAVLQEALALNSKVKTPFLYKGGFSSSSFLFDLDFLIFLLALICIVINSPVFSAEYQTGSDDILRSTKNGRTSLSINKLAASLLIDVMIFAVCISIYVLIIGNSYGWDSLLSSIQVFIPDSFLPITIGQEQGWIILAGFFSLFAVSCFTMFLSARCRTSTTTLIIAIAFSLLPDILYMITQWNGNFCGVLGSILPSGGLGISNNFYDQMKKMLFLQLGPFSIWAPFLIFGAAVLEIPLFFILAIRTYCKHQVA